MSSFAHFEISMLSCQKTRKIDRNPGFFETGKIFGLSCFKNTGRCPAHRFQICKHDFFFWRLCFKKSIYFEILGRVIKLFLVQKISEIFDKIMVVFLDFSAIISDFFLFFRSFFEISIFFEMNSMTVFHEFKTGKTTYCQLSFAKKTVPICQPIPEKPRFPP